MGEDDRTVMARRKDLRFSTGISFFPKVSRAVEALRLFLLEEGAVGIGLLRRGVARADLDHESPALQIMDITHGNHVGFLH